MSNHPTVSSLDPISTHAHEQADKLEFPQLIQVSVERDNDALTYQSRTVVFIEPTREQSNTWHKFPAVSTPTFTPNIVAHMVQPSIHQNTMVSNLNCKKMFQS